MPGPVTVPQFYAFTSGTANAGDGTLYSVPASPATVPVASQIVSQPVLPVTVTQNWQGQPAGTTVTPANSGTPPSTAFDSVTATTGATNTYDNADSAHGGESNLITTSATAGNSYGLWSAAVGTQTTVWVRLYVKITAIGTQYRIFGSNSVLAATAGAIIVTTTGHLGFTNAAGSSVLTTTAVMPVGTWFRVEAMLTGHATAGQWQYWLFTSSMDGTVPDETNISAATQAMGGALADYRIGLSGTAAASVSYRLDDAGVSNVGPLGPVVVLPAPAVIAACRRPFPRHSASRITSPPQPPPVAAAFAAAPRRPATRRPRGGITAAFPPVTVAAPPVLPAPAFTQAARRLPGRRPRGQVTAGQRGSLTVPVPAVPVTRATGRQPPRRPHGVLTAPVPPAVAAAPAQPAPAAVQARRLARPQPRRGRVVPGLPPVTVAAPVLPVPAQVQAKRRPAVPRPRGHVTGGVLPAVLPAPPVVAAAGRRPLAARRGRFWGPQAPPGVVTVPRVPAFTRAMRRPPPRQRLRRLTWPLLPAGPVVPSAPGQVAVSSSLANQAAVSSSAAGAAEVASAQAGGILVGSAAPAVAVSSRLVTSGDRGYTFAYPQHYPYPAP